MSASKSDTRPKPDPHQIVITSPCPMDWEQMRGDDKVRFCDQCGKPVYNFAVLTGSQAREMITKGTDNLCGRIVRKADGTIATTASYPVDSRRSRPFQFTIAALIMLITSSAALFAAVPVVSRVIGPIVEKWLNKPGVNNPPPVAAGQFVLGAIEMGEIDLIDETECDRE